MENKDFNFEEIKRQSLGIGVGIISEKIIDEVNIYEATKHRFWQYDCCGAAHCRGQPRFCAH